MSTTTALLKSLRSTGLSQSDIARLTGIPQPRLSRWESGDAPAGADDALKLHQLQTDLAAKAGTVSTPPPETRHAA